MYSLSKRIYSAAYAIAIWKESSEVMDRCTSLFQYILRVKIDRSYCLSITGEVVVALNYHLGI